VRGRLLALGIDPAGLHLRQLLDLLYMLLVDHLADPWSRREELMDTLDENMLNSVTIPRRRTWGLSSQAAAGQRAMMALAGGGFPKTRRPVEGDSSQ
jgi:hypothetical protein